MIVDESIYYMVDDSQNRSQICEAGCVNAEQRGGRAERGKGWEGGCEEEVGEVRGSMVSAEHEARREDLNVESLGEKGRPLMPLCDSYHGGFN